MILQPEAGQDPNRFWRRLHRGSACIVAVFLVLHLGNHFFAFAGPDAHIAAMEELRLFYRNPIAETVLMAALVWQIVTGAIMLRRRWQSGIAGVIGITQAASGLVLLIFLLNHLAAIWIGRLLLELDTNFWFAAAGFHAGLLAFFAPYYFLGVFALGAHLACALWWSLDVRFRDAVFVLVVFGAGLLALALVLTMAFTADVPAEYLATYS